MRHPARNPLGPKKNELPAARPGVLDTSGVMSEAIADSLPKPIRTPADSHSETSRKFSALYYAQGPRGCDGVSAALN